MDIKDINIRNLQSEIVRLRNRLADRDAYVQSVEQDREEWTIQLFYYSPAKVYTKVYEIGRFNVPKSDPMNSKKPQTIVENNPLMPSFCRFYFESKFAYNLSEENVIRMLESMKCHFPQSTLNKYIHQIMDYLRTRLEALMLEVIRSCNFVQNDETRILVRSRKSKEDNFKYNTEYIAARAKRIISSTIRSIYMQPCHWRRNWL